MSRAFSKILVLVILIALAGGGIFAWQHFAAPKEKVKTPEQVILQFYQGYIAASERDKYINLSNDLKEDYKNLLLATGTVRLVDPILWAQDIPPVDNLQVEKAEISNGTASVDVTFLPIWPNHKVRVSLSLINNEWKISNIEDVSEGIIKDETSSKKIIPLIPQKDTTTPQWLLVLVEDSLYSGLKNELNTYSADVKRELGFETILKTFSSSASTFEVQSYIKQTYKNYKLNGALLVGNLPSGQFYHPKGYYSKDNLPQYDYIYQDIYDNCTYSQEWNAFSYESPSCEHDRVQPFWVSRLTPNSSSKDSLLLLKDYFKRNHDYRTGQYSYKQKVLLYLPILLETNQPYRGNTIAEIEKKLGFFNTYDENKYNLINIERNDSDQIYLSEIEKTYEYENLLFNGHGSPIWHQKNIATNDIVNAGFFLGDFRSCSVGSFTVKDYIVGKYLFEGKSLAAIAAPVSVTAVSEPNFQMYYLLSIGEPLYEAIKISGLGGANTLGDLTLRMRYQKKPSTSQSSGPVISFDRTYLSLTNDQPKIDLKIKNLGESTLKFNMYPKYYKFKQNWQEGSISRSTFTNIEFDQNGNYIFNPNEEVEFTIETNFESKPPAGTYKGEIFVLSNDPINPYLGIPFELIVK